MKRTFYLLITALLLVACKKNEVGIDIKLKDNVFEYREILHACEAVESINDQPIDSIDKDNSTLLSNGILVSCEASDLSTLGEKMLIFKYNRDESQEFLINIVDTVAPVIEFDVEEIEVEIGNLYFDIHNLIQVNDNYDSEVKLQVDGHYNLDEVGAYRLKLIAKDSSGNESQRDVVVKVLEKEKEVVTVVEEVPVYVGGSASSTDKRSQSSSSGSQSGGSGNTTKPITPRPSNKTYMFEDGYTIQTAPKACSEDLNKAYYAGWGGSCTAIYSDDGVATGVKLTINE